jgi:hypothetical protein
MDIKSSIENLKTKKVTFTNTSTEFTGSYNDLDDRINFSDDFYVDSENNISLKNSSGINIENRDTIKNNITSTESQSVGLPTIKTLKSYNKEPLSYTNEKKYKVLEQENSFQKEEIINTNEHFIVFTYEGKDEIVYDEKGKSTNTEYIINFRQSVKADILVVGGGGAGAYHRGGGGGGGGLIFYENYDLQARPYIIRVGKGGNWVLNSHGERGENSYFESLPEPIAYGGGGGCLLENQWSRTKNKLGNAGDKKVGAGGSGGGNAGMGMVKQGHLGGNYNNLNAGGGGGAGGIGYGDDTGLDNPAYRCNGGIGLDLSKYFGTNVGDEGWFAGGGGGSVHFDQFNGECAPTSSNGGKGGGGSAGRFRQKRGQDGMPNTGGGGGGGSNINQAQGGNGGSGVVIIKYYSDEECHYFTDPFDLYNKEIKIPTRFGLYGFSSHSDYPISNMFLANLTRESLKYYNDKLPYHTSDLIDKSGFWIKFEQPTIINNFINTAANDTIGRDPIRVRIEGSNGPDDPSDPNNNVNTEINFEYNSNGQHLVSEDGKWDIICENIELCGYKDISRHNEYNNNSGTNFTNLKPYRYYKFIILESLNDTELQISLTRFFGPKTKSDVRHLDEKNVIYNEIDSDTYYLELHHDTSSDEQTEYNIEVGTSLSDVKILMIAGGGAGGSPAGGGGGAGGLLYTENNITISTGTYNVKVGRGGYGSGDTNKGDRGFDSEFDGTIIYGGGGGSYWNLGSDTSLTSTKSIRGGSGGGGGGPANLGGVARTDIIYGLTLTSSNSTYYGNDGGKGAINDSAGANSYWDAKGGGGGGAGQPGFDSDYIDNSNCYNSGCGGNGIELDITGQLKYYAGGGGSCGDIGLSPGGAGGGGNAGRSLYRSAHISNGKRGTGGGGGGTQSNAYWSGDGGSGIFILKYTGVNHPKVYSTEREYPPVREIVNNEQEVDNICINRTTYSKRISYGKGVYKINYSQQNNFGKTSINTARRTDFNTLPHNIFNDSNSGSYWLENNYLSGEYNRIEYLNNDYNGDWITIELPYEIYLTKYKIKQNTSYINNSPKDFKIYGSNNGIDWIEINHTTNADTLYTSNICELVFSSNTSYKHFGLVVNKLIGNTNTLYISDIYILGKEEYPIKIYDTNTELLSELKEDGWRKVKFQNNTINKFPLCGVELFSNKKEEFLRNNVINYYEKFNNIDFTEYLFLRKTDTTYKWLICEKSELLDRKATGLKWKNLGTEKPKYGKQINNEKLSNKFLESKLEFTYNEWSKFEINNLIGSDYVKAGNNYYQPNELDWTNVKIKKSSISDKPYYVDWQTYSYGPGNLNDITNVSTSVAIYKPIISIDSTKTIDNVGTISSSTSHILYIEDNNENITLDLTDGNSYVYIRNVIDYEYMASSATNLENWKLVRWNPPLPKTDHHNNKLPCAHPTRDQLGWYENSVYGTTDDYDDPWSLHLGRTDQYLFAMGNMYYWGIFEKEDLTRYLINQDSKILKSSLSDYTSQSWFTNTYQRIWDNHDPNITLKDHNENFDNIWLYYANAWYSFHSSTNRYQYVFNGGSCVFIKTDDIIKPYEYKRKGGKGITLDIDKDFLKLWYDFNGDFKDKNPSNDKYDIEYSGSVSFSDNAIYGKSAKFKRDELSTEYLKINSNFDFHNLWDNKGISISVWVYVEDYSSLPSWARIYEFSIDDLAQDRIALMRYSNTSYFEVRIMSNNIENSARFGYDELITNNHTPEWHHIVWTIDKLGIWTVYLNGKNQNLKESRYYYNGTTRNVQMSEPILKKHFNRLYIGKACDKTTESWYGNIDDFRIYNKVINYSDVSALYNIKYQNIKLQQNLLQELTPIYSNPTKSWVDNEGYTYFVYHHDQSTNDHTIYNVYFENNVEAYVLIVGGGGSGADSGGGGAGEVVFLKETLKIGNKVIKVGKGGQTTTSHDLGYHGLYSQFDKIKALGGGGGTRAANYMQAVGCGGGCGYDDQQFPSNSYYFNYIKAIKNDGYPSIGGETIRTSHGSGGGGGGFGENGNNPWTDEGLWIDSSTGKLYEHLNNKNFSISFWAKPLDNGESGEGHLIYGAQKGKAEEGLLSIGNSGMAIHMQNNNFRFRVTQKDTTTYSYIETTSVTFGNWYYIYWGFEYKTNKKFDDPLHTWKIVVYDLSNETVIHNQIYEEDKYIPYINYSYNFTIGRWSSGANGFTQNARKFNGNIEDFRIYDKLLTDSEIEILYTLPPEIINILNYNNDNIEKISFDSYNVIIFKNNNEDQTQYSINFPEDTTCDILVVGGGGAGGGNGQGGGGGAGAVIYYENIVLNGEYSIYVGNGGKDGNRANNGSSGKDTEFKKTSNNTQRFLAKGGGGGGTWSTSGYRAKDGGSGGGGAGGYNGSNGASGLLISGNIVNDTNITISNNLYVNTGFTGDRGVDSLNDTGCFGNIGGYEPAGGDDDWGAGGGGAGTIGAPTIEGSVDNAGDGGSGKKFNITGQISYYGGGGGGGMRPTTDFNTGSRVGYGGLGGGGNGGGGYYGQSDSNGGDAINGTGGGGGGVGAINTLNHRGGYGGSGIVIIRYNNSNVVNIHNQGKSETYNEIVNSEDNLIVWYKFDDSSNLGKNSSKYGTKLNAKASDYRIIDTNENNYLFGKGSIRFWNDNNKDLNLWSDTGNTQYRTYGGNGGDGINKYIYNGYEYNFEDVFTKNVGEYVEGEGVYFAGGGAGGTNLANSFDNIKRTNGGKGGGGKSNIGEIGGIEERYGLDGLPHTGGGGGGGDADINCGAGGSGVVIIKFKESKIEPKYLDSSKNPNIIKDIEDNNKNIIFFENKDYCKELELDSKYLIHHWNFNNSLNDLITNSVNVNVDTGNNFYDTNNKREGKSSLSTTNIDGYITIPKLNPYNIFYFNDFSYNYYQGISFVLWYKNTNTSATGISKLINFQETNTGISGISLSIDWDNNKLIFNIANTIFEYVDNNISDYHNEERFNNYFDIINDPDYINNSNKNTEWHHIVWSIDKELGYWSIYIDGKNVMNLEKIKAIDNINWNHNTLCEYFDGNIDGFRIYNKVLNLNHVKTLYNYNKYEIDFSEPINADVYIGYKTEYNGVKIAKYQNKNLYGVYKFNLNSDNSKLVSKYTGINPDYDLNIEATSSSTNTLDFTNSLNFQNNFLLFRYTYNDIRYNNSFQLINTNNNNPISDYNGEWLKISLEKEIIPTSFEISTYKHLANIKIENNAFIDCKYLKYENVPYQISIDKNHLIAHYIFDDPDDLYKDTSSFGVKYNFNNTGLGVISNNEKKIGSGSLLLDNNSYLTISEYASISHLRFYQENGFSFCTWYKRLKVDGVFTNNCLFASNEFFIVLHEDNYIYILNTNDTGETYIHTNGIDVNNEEWHHLAFVWDQDGYWHLYFDYTKWSPISIEGANSGEGTISYYSGGSYPITTATQFIPFDSRKQVGGGNLGSWSDNKFNGYLDDIRIYNKGISESDVFNIYSKIFTNKIHTEVKLNGTYDILLMGRYQYNLLENIQISDGEYKVEISESITRILDTNNNVITTQDGTNISSNNQSYNYSLKNDITGYNIIYNHPICIIKQKLNLINYYDYLLKFNPIEFRIYGSNNDDFTNSQQLIDKVLNSTEKFDEKTGIYKEDFINIENISYKNYLLIVKKTSANYLKIDNFEIKGKELLESNPFKIDIYKPSLQDPDVYIIKHKYMERMYPPNRNFDNSIMTLTGYPYGNGTYKVTESLPTYDATNYFGYKVFNKTESQRYLSLAVYDVGNYCYEGNHTIDGTYFGEWIKIELPLQIYLTRYKFESYSTNTNRLPGTYKIYGSNDNLNWDVIVDRSKVPIKGSSEYENLNKNNGFMQNVGSSNYYRRKTSFNFSLNDNKFIEDNVNNCNNKYKYFALVVNKLTGTGSHLEIEGWYLYGREEQEKEELSDAYNYNYNIIKDITGCNWKHVKHIDKIATTWYPDNDNLQGNVLYGETNNKYNTWAIPWNNDKVYQYLFTMEESAEDELQMLVISPSNLQHLKTNTNKDWTTEKAIMYYSQREGINYDFDFSHYSVLTSYDNAPFIRLGTSNGKNLVYQENNGGWDAQPYDREYNVYIRELDSNENYYTNIVPKPIKIDNELYTYYLKFVHDNDNSTEYTEYKINFAKETIVDILVIGGGGGGARRMAGGGGAGTMIYDKDVKLAAGEYKIRVGKGGEGSYVSGNISNDGVSNIGQNVDIKRGRSGIASQIINSNNEVYYYADGGSGGIGGSADNFYPSKNLVLNGGSGGGGGAGNYCFGGLLSENNIVRGEKVKVINNTSTKLEYLPYYDSDKCFGNRGGDGKNSNPYHGGGGGGAGGPGGDTYNCASTSENNNKGFGGIGKLCDITGENIYYAGGGGGGNYTNYNNYNEGGLGGGGRSGMNSVYAHDGIDGTGGGGGGDSNDVKNGGNGGSGVVIIRYKKIPEITEAEEKTVDNDLSKKYVILRNNSLSDDVEYHIKLPEKLNCDILLSNNQKYIRYNNISLENDYKIVVRYDNETSIYQNNNLILDTSNGIDSTNFYDDITGTTENYTLPIVIIKYNCKKYIEYKYNQDYVKNTLLDFDDNHLKLWYKFDKDLNDSISNNHIREISYSADINNLFTDLYDSKFKNIKRLKTINDVYVKLPLAINEFIGHIDNTYDFAKYATYSIAFWCKFTADTEFIFGSCYVNSDNTYDRQIIQYSGNNKLYWTRQNNITSGTTYSGIDVYVDYITNNEWTHIVLLSGWEDNNIYSRIFINNVEQSVNIASEGTQQFEDPVDYLSINNNFILGGTYTTDGITINADGTQEFLDFRIYNKLLDHNEIDKIYNIYSQTIYNVEFKEDSVINLLGVAGGGSGGADYGGGGGSGGLIEVYNKNIQKKTDSYTIKVGKGGDRVISNNNTGKLQGQTGGNTEIFNTILRGGGGGGSYGYNGLDGGSGGGGGYNIKKGGNIFKPHYSDIINNIYNDNYLSYYGSKSVATSSGKGGGEYYETNIIGDKLTLGQGGKGRTDYDNLDIRMYFDDAVNYGEGGGGAGWPKWIRNVNPVSGKGGDGITIINYSLLKENPKINIISDNICYVKFISDLNNDNTYSEYSIKFDKETNVDILLSNNNKFKELNQQALDGEYNIYVSKTSEKTYITLNGNEEFSTTTGFTSYTNNFTNNITGIDEIYTSIVIFKFDISNFIPTYELTNDQLLLYGGTYTDVISLDDNVSYQYIENNIYKNNYHINSLTGMYGWKKIKNLPWLNNDDLRWYYGNTFGGDRIDGTISYGNNNNNNEQWSIPFNPIAVKYYLFTSKDSSYNSEYQDRFVVFNTEVLTTNLNNVAKGSYNETGYPNGKSGAIYYNRTGTSTDPLIGRQYYIKKSGELFTNKTDIGYPLDYYVYAEDSTTGWNGRPPVDCEVYIKESEDIPVPTTENLVSIFESIDENNDIYKILVFKSDKICEHTEFNITFDNPVKADILLIGGGGAGGECHGGGGGAGSIVFINNVTLHKTYKIKVGGGGYCQSDPIDKNSGIGLNGKSSEIINMENNDVLIADGGGGAGGDDFNGAVGGSGGGANAYSQGSDGIYRNNQFKYGGNASNNIPLFNGKYGVKYGNKGGDAFIAKNSADGQTAGGGGGGGGAGNNGENAYAINNPANGGSGIYSVIINNIEYKFKNHFKLPTDNSIGIYYKNEIYFAGGGGGAFWHNPLDTEQKWGYGGIGGGGNGGDVNTVGNDGIDNTGSGGGGGGQGGTTTYGGKGGSGLVIIKYKIESYKKNVYKVDYNYFNTPYYEEETIIEKHPIINLKDNLYPSNRNITDKTLYTSSIYDNGTYFITYSTSYNNFLNNYNPIYLFDSNQEKIASFGNAEYKKGDIYSYYIGNNHINNYKGDWIKIEMPYKIKITSSEFITNNILLDSSPRKYKIFASNETYIWKELFEGDILKSDYINFIHNDIITINEYYNNFCLCCNAIGSEKESLSFLEWKINGDQILKRISYYENEAEKITGVSGWNHVKHLPPTNTSWYPYNDDLFGNYTYGTHLDYYDNWAVPFNDFDEILFVRNNFEKWLYINKSDHDREWSSSWVTKISIATHLGKNTVYSYYYNEDASPYFAFGSNDQDPEQTNVIYVENNSNWKYTSGLNYTYDVYVRNSQNPKTKLYYQIEPVKIDNTLNTYYIEFLYYNLGSLHTNYNIEFMNDSVSDILVVGGGGNGGGYIGGGGGGGSVYYNKNYTFNKDIIYNIQVGKGGNNDNNNGSYSSINNNSGTLNIKAGGGAGNMGKQLTSPSIMMYNTFINLEDLYDITSPQYEYISDSSLYFANLHSDGKHKYLYLIYESTNDNGENQTEYTFNVPELLGEFDCDILLVGGGCTGHRGIQDGGAGGAVVYEENYKLQPGNYTIYIAGTGKLITVGDYLLDTYTGTSWEEEPITQFSGIKNNSTGEFILKAMGAKPSNNWNIQGNTNPSGGTRPENIGNVLNGEGTNLSGGGDGYPTTGTSGPGQDGPQVNITGVNTYFAGGGGGGNYHWPVGGYQGSGGPGGLGGGGYGARYGNGGHAQSHTGGGGGGAGNDRGIDNRPGGNGGSGVVIIKFKEPIFKAVLGTNYDGIDGVSGSGGGGILYLDLSDRPIKDLSSENEKNLNYVFYKELNSIYNSNTNEYTITEYVMFQHNSNNENDTEFNFNISSDVSADFLIVAGGGGGGMDMGGGGGGGGVIIGKEFNFTAGNYKVVVGNGGRGGPSAGGNSTQLPVGNNDNGYQGVSGHQYQYSAYNGFDSYIKKINDNSISFVASGGGHGASSVATYKPDLGAAGDGGCGGGTSGYNGADSGTMHGLAISQYNHVHPPSGVWGMPTAADDASNTTSTIFNLSEVKDVNNYSPWMKHISRSEYESNNTIVGFSQIINGDLYEFRTNFSGAGNGKFYELFDEYKTHRNLFDTNNLGNNYYIHFYDFADSTGRYDANGFNGHDIVELSDGTKYKGIWIEVGRNNGNDNDKFILTGYSFSYADNDNYRNQRSLEEWLVCGTNDRSGTWTEIHRVEGSVSYPDVLRNIPNNMYPEYFSSFPKPDAYKYYRLIITKIDVDTWLALSSLRFYGYQDNSSILTIPNIYTNVNNIDSELYAHYKFNDYSNVGYDSIRDANGNGNDLINHNTELTPTYAVEHSSVYFHTNYTTYLEFPSSFNIYEIWNGNGITFSFWYKIKENSGNWWKFLDFQENLESNYGFFIGKYSNSDSQFVIEMNNANSRIIVNVHTHYDRQWHNLAFTVSIDGVWTLYLDGINQNISMTCQIPNINYTIGYVNKSAYSADQEWAGNMDDLRIYSKELSQEEVGKLFSLKTKELIGGKQQLYNGVYMYGNHGGHTASSHYPGGGGGAGTIGHGNRNRHPDFRSANGHGGDGIQCDILGPNYYWAGGGGGSGYSTTGGNGGLGGGGGGAVNTTYGGIGGYNDGENGGGGGVNSQTNTPGGDGAQHTGSGGGGGSHYSGNNRGGKGGSGIVVIKYKYTTSILKRPLNSTGGDTNISNNSFIVNNINEIQSPSLNSVIKTGNSGGKGTILQTGNLINVSGGGGGGANSSGKDAVFISDNYNIKLGGDGGDSVGINITNNIRFYGGGGGGGSYFQYPIIGIISQGGYKSGGNGGISNDSTYEISATDPIPNSGGGGGGGNIISDGTNGANGVVIIKYTTLINTQNTKKIKSGFLNYNNDKWNISENISLSNLPIPQPEDKNQYPVFLRYNFINSLWETKNILSTPVNNFTGQHITMTNDKTLKTKVGYIVCSDNTYHDSNWKYSKNNLSKNIDIIESLPYVKLSNKKNQKSVIGVISNKQQKLIFDNTIEINNNSLNNQIIINSLGEGAIWVSNYNRSLSNGDYITTSDIPGIGMKQDGDLLHNYTVAKITMDCDFNPRNIPLQKYVYLNGEIQLDNNGDYLLEYEYDKYNNIIYEKEYQIKYIKNDGTIISEDEYNNLLIEHILYIADNDIKLKTYLVNNNVYKENLIPSDLSKYFSDILENFDYLTSNVIFENINDENFETNLSQYILDQSSSNINLQSYLYEKISNNKNYNIEFLLEKLVYLENNFSCLWKNKPVFKIAFVGCTYHCG